jgi:hypothetical protein
MESGKTCSLSETCFLNYLGNQGVKIFKKKQKRMKDGSTDPKTFYYYNITIEKAVIKRILDHCQIIERQLSQIKHKTISSPYVLDLGVNQRVILISEFKSVLYIGLHLYCFDNQQIIPSHGMNWTIQEFRRLCDYLRQTTNPEAGLFFTQSYFQWRWILDGQIEAEDSWFPSEIMCMQNAMYHKPGHEWTLDILTKQVDFEMNDEMLDVVLSELIKRKIYCLSNSLQYYLNEPCEKPTLCTIAQLEMFGEEAFNSIQQSDILEMALVIMKKLGRISLQDSTEIMKKVAHYNKKTDILVDMKSNKLNADLIQLISQ